MSRVLLVLTGALALSLCSCSKKTQQDTGNGYRIPAADLALLDYKDPSFKPFPHDDPRVQVKEDGTKIIDLPPASPALVEIGRTAVPGRDIRVHYKGWLPDGKIFDDSWSRGQPSQFLLAKGSVVDGFVSGIDGMKEGSARWVWIPAEKAYGERGTGGIPPNTPIFFEIHLVEVLDKTANPDEAIDRDRD